MPYRSDEQSELNANRLSNTLSSLLTFILSQMKFPNKNEWTLDSGQALANVNLLVSLANFPFLIQKVPFQFIAQNGTSLLHDNCWLIVWANRRGELTDACFQIWTQTPHLIRRICSVSLVALPKRFVFHFVFSSNVSSSLLILLFVETDHIQALIQIEQHKRVIWFCVKKTEIHWQFVDYR